MVKVFMGLPGSGKTKHLIDLVNNAVENESGNVVCIELGQKLRFDLNHNAKLVDITEYDFQGSFETLTAFVSGMYAGNYDITHIFIDSTLKIAGTDDVAAIEDFLGRLDAFSEKTGVKFTVSLSTDVSRATDKIKKYF
ncbi:MAG TPA: hypothetical protein H9666_11000 [Firmicutes bacterium]|nr:hypothetical protein [Bacillota bacterium]